MDVIGSNSWKRSAQLTLQDCQRVQRRSPFSQMTSINSISHKQQGFLSLVLIKKLYRFTLADTIIRASPFQFMYVSMKTIVFLTNSRNARGEVKDPWRALKEGVAGRSRRNGDFPPRGHWFGNLHFGGRFLDDHSRFVVILFFRRPSVVHFIWWTLFKQPFVRHFIWWTFFGGRHI